MNRKLTRFFALFCAILMSASACGSDTPAPSGDTTAAADETTAAPEGYDYAGKDFGGETVNILNFEDLWKCYLHLDFESQTGEILDDAVYNRNRRVEEALNFKLNEVKWTDNTWETGQRAMIDAVIQSVMAGDNAYDAAYLPISFKSAIITDGYLYDLNTMPGLNLDEEYWDGNINKALELDGKLYAASSPMQLMSLDMANVLLFNEDMFTNMKMAHPYDMVREGTWTLDKLNEYVTALTQLNGDESFTFNNDGNAVYGMGVHPDIIMGMLHAAGCRLTENNGGKFTLTIDNERWYSAGEKINKILIGTGHAIADTSASDKNYIKLFREGRASFLLAELKASLELRDMKDSFGLLPMPKLDEEQKDYHTMVGFNTTLLTVPKTQANAERTGTVLDALSYESWKNILPIYFDVTLEQKGLRNENSIEMLEIIRSGVAVEPTLLLGITKSYVNTVDSNLLYSDGNLASLAASNKASLETKLQSVVDGLK